jgi:membrane-bound lytic murein transglycosylase F
MLALLLVTIPFWSLFVEEAGERAPRRAAQARQESGFNPSARSPVGAQGLTQFMPGTWREMIRRGAIPPDASPLDPRMSIRAQDFYMRSLLAWFRGDEEKAEAGYNAGQGNIDRGVRVVRKRGIIDTPERKAWLYVGLPAVTGDHARETQGYVERIERNHLPWVYRQIAKDAPHA